MHNRFTLIFLQSCRAAGLPCLDFGFQYALIRNNWSKKFGVEYWALPCSNSPWCAPLLLIDNWKMKKINTNEITKDIYFWIDKVFIFVFFCMSVSTSFWLLQLRRGWGRVDNGIDNSIFRVGSRKGIISWRKDHWFIVYYYIFFLSTDECLLSISFFIFK